MSLNNDTGANIRLSGSVTLADYRRLAAQADRVSIANFLCERLTERYLDPATTGKVHGVAMMAVACLLIEALQSYREGWPHTNRMSRQAFLTFFATTPRFAVFQPIAEQFYTEVRCGILHQGEPLACWLIRRRGPLYDAQLRCINAALFLPELRHVLDDYLDTLRMAAWDGELWDRVRIRMDTTCKNCY